MDQTMRSVKPVLKLFRISQNINNGYDTFDSAVVATYSAEEASRIHPNPDYPDMTTWVYPDDVIVKYIGMAGSHLKPGVVVSSFNAG